MSISTHLPRPAPTRQRTGFARIAVAVDTAEHSRDAVALASTLVEMTGAELLLVHVAPDPLTVLPELANWASVSAQGQAMLEELRDELAPEARIAVEPDTSVARGLERVARREHRDLVVVGSSSRAHNGSVHVGKHVRALLGHLECPLAIAPRGYAERPDGEIHRIAVGFDGAPESAAAFALAAAVAVAADDELDVETVVDDRVPPIGFSALAQGGADHPVWEDCVLAELDRRRERAIELSARLGVPAAIHPARGRPTAALLALSYRADLLVIGSRRWGPIARILLGSTGEAVVEEAGCPVIVVPRPHH